MEGIRGVAASEICDTKIRRLRKRIERIFVKKGIISSGSDEGAIRQRAFNKKNRNQFEGDPRQEIRMKHPYESAVLFENFIRKYF